MFWKDEDGNERSDEEGVEEEDDDEDDEGEDDGDEIDEEDDDEMQGMKSAVFVWWFFLHKWELPFVLFEVHF